MRPPSEPSDAFEPLTASRLVAKLGGDKELLLEIIGLFQSEGPIMVKALRERARGGDAPEIARAAHVLKGSAANFGSNPLYELAREIEHRARDNDLAGIDELGARLEHTAERFLEALQRLSREVRG